MGHFRSEEVSPSMPDLSVGIEARRVERDLEVVNGLAVVLGQVPDELVPVRTCQVEYIVFKDKIFLQRKLFTEL